MAQFELCESLQKAWINTFATLSPFHIWVLLCSMHKQAPPRLSGPKHLHVVDIHLSWCNATMPLNHDHKLIWHPSAHKCTHCIYAPSHRIHHRYLRQVCPSQMPLASYTQVHLGSTSGKVAPNMPSYLMPKCTKSTFFLNVHPSVSSRCAFDQVRPLSLPRWCATKWVCPNPL